MIPALLPQEHLVFPSETWSKVNPSLDFSLRPQLRILLVDCKHRDKCNIIFHTNLPIWSLWYNTKIKHYQLTKPHLACILWSSTTYKLKQVCVVRRQAEQLVTQCIAIETTAALRDFYVCKVCSRGCIKEWRWRLSVLLKREKAVKCSNISWWFERRFYVWPSATVNGEAAGKAQADPAPQHTEHVKCVPLEA